jgi:hypothetical protein
MKNPSFYSKKKKNKRKRKITLGPNHSFQGIVMVEFEKLILSINVVAKQFVYPSPFSIFSCHLSLQKNYLRLDLLIFLISLSNNALIVNNNDMIDQINWKQWYCSIYSC